MSLLLLSCSSIYRTVKARRKYQYGQVQNQNDKSFSTPSSTAPSLRIHLHKDKLISTVKRATTRRKQYQDRRQVAKTQLLHRDKSF